MRLGRPHPRLDRLLQVRHVVALENKVPARPGSPCQCHRAPGPSGTATNLRSKCLARKLLVVLVDPILVPALLTETVLLRRLSDMPCGGDRPCSEMEVGLLSRRARCSCCILTCCARTNAICMPPIRWAPTPDFVSSSALRTRQTSGFDRASSGRSGTPFVTAIEWCR